jgi:hypothetical protein
MIEQFRLDTALCEHFPWTSDWALSYRKVAAAKWYKGYNAMTRVCRAWNL